MTRRFLILLLLLALTAHGQKLVIRKADNATVAVTPGGDIGSISDAGVVELDDIVDVVSLDVLDAIGVPIIADDRSVPTSIIDLIAGQLDTGASVVHLDWLLKTLADGWSTTGTFTAAILQGGIAGATTGQLKLSGSTSGTITIKGANAAGTYTLTLPANDGGAGEVLTTDGNGLLSWGAGGSGLTVGTTTIASGTDTRILYNNAGVLGEYPIGAGISTFLATPTLANLNTAVSDANVAVTSAANSFTGQQIFLAGFTDTASGSIIVMSPTGSGTVTISPANGVTMTPAGGGVNIAPAGSGTLMLSSAAGTTLQSTGSGLTTITSGGTGTINKMSIGAITPSTGAFTTGSFSGTLTLGDGSGATAILASNLSGATDPTLTFGNNAITITNAATITSSGAVTYTTAAGNAIYTSGSGFATLGDSSHNAQLCGLWTVNATTGSLTTGGAYTFTTAGRITSTASTPATLAAAATTFAVTSNVATVTGDGGGNTVATITGGLSGMVLTLIFTDANVTITDDAGGTANTVNLSAAFTSTANDTLTLVHNGTSWREVGRSVN